MFRNMVCKCTIFSLAILCLLAFTSSAYAVQASGAVSILPADFTLEIGQQIDVGIRVTNASSDTLPTGLDVVPAVYDGTLTITMACESSTCAVELPGTLSFVPAVGNGCVSSVAEVTGCAASGDNAVVIGVSNLVIPGGGNVVVAVIRVQADTPVYPPEDGEFAMRGESGPNDLEACDSTDPDICATGGAEGSAPLFFPEVCGDEILNPDLGETCDPPLSTPDPDFPENLCRDTCTYCGDGIQNNGEDCDFNDPNAPAECRTNCTLAECGDGILDPDETCDPPGSTPDPNFPDNLCGPNCNYCGDGEVNNGEDCDFNDPNAPDNCRTDCTLAVCGDEILDPDLGETCDPPASIPDMNFPDNACRESCTYCGDGEVNNGEECDFNDPNAPPGCRTDCTLAECGDGILDPDLGETCDPPGSTPDPNFPDNVCRESCTYCGDGEVNNGEECDFNDPNAPPGCRDDCTVAVCGDGILDPDETCDPPGSTPDPNFPDNVCRESCTYCGDGEVNNGEACDFNDPNAPAGCRTDCTLIACGDGILDPGETCDPPGSTPDPNFPDNVCRESCTYCGDGLLNNNEECDFNDPNADPLCGFDCTIGVCEVKVDKQVSCDGGISFVDEGLVVASEDGTFSCDGVNGETIVVQYQAQNSGTFDVVDCAIAESNPEIGMGATVGDLPAGQTNDFIVDDDQVCSAELAAGEPDTATLTCQCATDIGGNIEVSAEDEASFTCPVGEGCITRTPGFWCARPFATDYLLPLDVCGITLTNVMTAENFSAIEDLTFSGKDFKPNNTSPQQLQLIRQCAAAALNLAASEQADGFCDSEFPGITDRFDECCMQLCNSGASGQAISMSGCIEDLDRFNNEDFDGNELPFPEDFPTSKDNGPGYFPPGPADSDNCSEANGNGFVNPDRNLGPR